MTVLSKPAKSLTTPAANGTAGNPAASPLRRQRFLLIALAVTATVAVALFTYRAYQRTILREADLPQLEALAQQSPFDATLQVVLGGRLSQAGEYLAATDHFQKAVAAGATQADVWQIWAAAVAAAGKRRDALAVLELGKNRVRTAQEAALLKEAQSRALSTPETAPPGAVARAICPTGIDAILAKRTPGSFLNGLFAWQGRRYPEQSGFLTRQRWAADEPDNPQALRWWGVALVGNRRLAAAESVLSHAVTLAPQDLEIRLALADVLRQSGAAARAGREYEAILKQRKDWPPALLGLGQVALDKSLIGLSVSVYQRATKVAPQSADAWIGLGRAYYSTHIQIGQSVTAFQKAVALAPERTDFYPDYCRALRLTFHYAEAEALIRRRLSVAPDDSQSHFLLAALLRDFEPTPERESEMERELRTSLELAPDSEATKTELAQLLLRRNKPEEAISLLNDVLTKDELNVKAIQMLERAYRQAGTPDIAERFRQHAEGQVRLAKRLGELEDAEHRSPGDPKIHASLAELYATLGRAVEAEQEKQFAAYLHQRPVSAKRGIQTLDAATTVSHPVKP